VPAEWRLRWPGATSLRPSPAIFWQFTFMHLVIGSASSATFRPLIADIRTGFKRVEAIAGGPSERPAKHLGGAHLRRPIVTAR